MSDNEQQAGEEDRIAGACTCPPSDSPSHRLGCPTTGWRPEHGDSRCQACGRPNPIWFADNALWNQVMGGEGGILCPTCFALKAYPLGLWKLVLDDSDDEEFCPRCFAGLTSSEHHEKCQPRSDGQS